MQLNNLKRTHKLKISAPVGRGGKRGKTSGRGTKGQNARAGRKLRPEIRDVIMRLPKLRGRGTNTFASRFSKPIAIKIGVLDRKFEKGAQVDLKTLVEAGLIKDKDKNRAVKILGGGNLSKALNLVGFEVSASVKEVVLKAGGSIK